MFCFHLETGLLTGNSATARLLLPLRPLLAPGNLARSAPGAAGSAQTPLSSRCSHLPGYLEPLLSLQLPSELMTPVSAFQLCGRLPDLPGSIYGAFQPEMRSTSLLPVSLAASGPSLETGTGQRDTGSSEAGPHEG